MELPKCPITRHNLVQQLPGYRSGYIYEALKPFGEIASPILLVPRGVDGVLPPHIHRQSFHQNRDNVLMQRFPASPPPLHHGAVTFHTDPTHICTHPSRILFPPERGCGPSPGQPRYPLRACIGGGLFVVLPGRPVGTDILVPQVRGTVGVVLNAPKVVVPTDAVVPSCLGTPVRCLPTGDSHFKPVSTT